MQRVTYALILLAMMNSVALGDMSILMLDRGGVAANAELYFVDPYVSNADWDQGAHGPAWPCSYQGVWAESVAIDSGEKLHAWAYMVWDSEKDLYVTAVVEPESPPSGRGRGYAEVAAWWNFRVAADDQWIAFSPDADPSPTVTLEDLTAGTIFTSTSQEMMHLQDAHTYRLTVRSVAPEMATTSHAQITFSEAPVAVPLPGAVLLGATGFAALGLCRRARRKAN